MIWRTSSILLAIVLTANTTSAQKRVEISPFFGYQVGGGVTSFPGRLDVDADTSYGVFVDVRVRPDLQQRGVRQAVEHDVL